MDKAPSETSAAAQQKTCPECAESIQAAAAICRFCGYDFRSGSRAPARVTPERPDARRQMGVIVSVVGGLMMVVGSFLPWVKVSSGFGSISRNGVEDGGDGVLFVIGGIIVLLVALSQLTSSPNQKLPLLIIAIGALGIIMGVMDWGEVDSRVSEANTVGGGFASASSGAGIFTVTLGSLIALIGGSMFLDKRK